MSLIKKPTLKRLARQAGIQSLSGDSYDIMNKIIKDFVVSFITEAIEIRDGVRDLKMIDEAVVWKAWKYYNIAERKVEGLEIPRSTFKRLLNEYYDTDAYEWLHPDSQKKPIKYTKAAIDDFIVFTCSYIIHVYELAKMLAVQRKRVRVSKQDLEVVQFLKKSDCNGPQAALLTRELK